MGFFDSAVDNFRNNVDTIYNESRDLISGRSNIGNFIDKTSLAGATEILGDVGGRTKAELDPNDIKAVRNTAAVVGAVYGGALAYGAYAGEAGGATQAEMLAAQESGLSAGAVAGEVATTTPWYEKVAEYIGLGQLSGRGGGGSASSPGGGSQTYLTVPTANQKSLPGGIGAGTISPATQKMLMTAIPVFVIGYILWRYLKK